MNARNATRIAGPTALLFVASLVTSACTSNAPSSATSASQPAAASTTTPASASARSARAHITNEFSAQATVTAIDAERRLVTLRREDGDLVEVRASPDVRNFDKIAVGDQLRVKYAEKLEVALVPSGGGAQPAGAALEVVRAREGAAQPAGGVGVGVSLRVKIESIDRAHDLVVFSLASGELTTHRVATPEGRKFLSEIQVGDTVQIDYAQALALTIEKV
jgi:hypothetical protein